MSYFDKKSDSVQHRKVLHDTINELELKGYRAFDLDNKMPDGIAYKNGKLYAIEILIVSHIPKNGWADLQIVKDKRITYSMFDNIIFRVVKRNKNIKKYDMKKITFMTPEERGRMIVDDFINDFDFKTEVNDE